MAEKSSHIVNIKTERFYIQRTKVTLSHSPTKQLQKFAADFVPVTAIRWDRPTFEESDLHLSCEEYSAKDDVWSTEFLAFVVLLRPSGLKAEVRSKKVFQVDNSKDLLPIGPLMVEKSTGHVLKVAKLVVDTHHAFLSATVPVLKLKAGFRQFPESDVLEIALPSRLYFTPSDRRPLAGLRVAVKDNIALKGLRTGYGSRAWAETYGPEEYTAPCVQKLIDAGAIIVGKVKSSEFAEGVDPANWDEGICPFNPRGDGEQKPSSSSTGSASAVAAYKWLDISYGTDTGGSIRHPAGVQGLFGQRPTHGSIDLKGVLGPTPLFDTVGIFAREARTFTKVGSYLVNQAKGATAHSERRKYNLLYPTRAPQVNNRDPFHGNQLRWFPHPEVDLSSYSDAEKQIEGIVSRMEAELDCKRVPFNLDELWRATHPIGQSRSIDEATGFIYGTITTASACETGINQFMIDYATAHNGQEPPISKMVKDRFKYGRECSGERISAALEAMQAFSRWVLNDLFGSLDQDAITLLIFPQSWGRPDDRNEVPEKAVLFKEYFSIYSFAYLCGCPDYTIPVSEVPFHSPVTNQIEHLPVSVSLVGRPGTDLELFGVIDHLHATGVISDVMAGKRMYTDKAATAGANMFPALEI